MPFLPVIDLSIEFDAILFSIVLFCFEPREEKLQFLLS